MPISVTCQCGARLDIDEKFLGKEIPCPDCQRPLPTTANVQPPPLDLPDDHRRISGLALLSLVLAIVGAFTIIGTLAAIAVGILAIKEITSKSSKLEGLLYARAGIIIGAVCTFLTLIALVSPTVFGLDVFLREMAFAGRLKYPEDEFISTGHSQKENFALKRPTPVRNWGHYITPTNLSNNQEADDLIMVNLAEDAFIAAQSLSEGLPDNDEEKTEKVMERFYKSELVSLLGKLNGKPLGTKGVIVSEKLIDPNTNKEITIGEVGDNTDKEVTLDLRLGGIDRRFLIQYKAKDPGLLLVGVSRVNTFERMREVFRETFKTKKASK